MAIGDVVIGRIAFTPADQQTLRLIRAEPYAAKCARLAERLFLSRNGAKQRLDHLRLQTGTSSVNELLEWVWRNGKAIDEALGDGSPPVSVAEAELGDPVQRLATAGSDGRADVGRSMTEPAWGATSGEHLPREATASRPGDNENVNRRDFLVDLTVVGLAAPLAGVEAVRHGLVAAVVGDGPADVDEWDRIVHEYAHSFCVVPTDRLLRDLTVDLSVLQHHLVEAGSTLKRGLARAGAVLAAICAMAWRNAGEPASAQRWWRTARRLADHSGDLEARTWVRGKEVVSSLYEQRPVSVVLDRAAEAASIAGSLASVGSAALYGGLAQTLAVAGRGDEALAALGRVVDLTHRLPPGVVADKDSLLGWPEVRLRYNESYVHTHLGNTRQANVAQEAALEIYPERLARDRAIVLLHRSTCMVQDGDVGGGLAYAGQVLDSLPTEHHVESVYANGWAVLQVVPAGERARREAADLRARLALSPSGAQ